MDQNGQKNADSNPENKGDKQIGAKISKRIGEFLILLIYLVIDAFEVWPRTHVGALLAFVAGLIALMLLDGEFSYKSLGGVGIAAATTSILIYVLVGPAMEPPIIGWLQATNEPTPPNACDVIPPERRRAANPIILLGSIAMIAGSPTAYNAISLGSCTPLSIRHTDSGTAVTADLYSGEGKLIGTLRDNGYSIQGNQQLIVERSADLSTLVVHDHQGHELLYIRILNPRAVRIRGILACPTPSLRVLAITDDKLIDPMGNVFGGCLNGGPTGYKG